MAWVYGFEIREDLNDKIMIFKAKHRLPRKSEAIIKMLEGFK